MPLAPLADGDSRWRERRGEVAESLRVRGARVTEEVARRAGRAIAVTLPENGGNTPDWDPAAFDRAVERDARRYDGEFPLY